MGLGGLILMLALGFLVLGPKQMQNVLRQIARVKAELTSATQSLKMQLSAELKDATQDHKDL